jgi:beta-N-acetylhexosaminidase
LTPRELSELCGAIIVGGLDGTALDALTARAIAEGRRAGVILFRRNTPSVEAVHALATEIVRTASADPGPFIAVDQEGGRVVRIPAPAVQLPAMRVLGDIGDADLVRRAATAVAIELRALGVNLNFAPVLDVDTNPDNPVIGDRSFARDPVLVGALGAAFAQGLESNGVLSCGKHFPGHGDTDRDSHLDLPVVRADRERLEAVELLPFRTAKNAVSSIMTAHVVFEALEPGVPATQSHAILVEVLRKSIGYQGLVFSDDLEMRALADRETVEESAIKAVRAGCDVLLVCKEFDLAERAHAALVKEAEKSDSFRARCADAAARSRSVRARFPAKPVASVEDLRRVFSESIGSGLLAEIAERSKRGQAAVE